MSALNRSAWALREQLRPELPVRSRACGRTRYVKSPLLRSAGRGSYFDGVQRCRARVCPVCYLSRRFKLLAEVHYVAEAHAEATRHVPLLATLTVRHSAADGCSITKQVRKVWAKFIAGKEWTEFSRKHGVEWICAEEITIGENGWHPHLHVAVLPRERPRDILETASWWAERWMRLVEKHMGAEHKPSFYAGFDLRESPVVEYVAKLTFDSLAFELTDAGQVKGSSPLSLVTSGDVRRYMELQRMRHRARDITWSKGLRPLRDAFAEQPKPEHEPLALFRGSEFERLAAKGVSALLDVVEQHDAAALACVLAQLDIKAEAIGSAAVAEALARES